MFGGSDFTSDLKAMQFYVRETGSFIDVCN